MPNLDIGNRRLPTLDAIQEITAVCLIVVVGIFLDQRFTAVGAFFGGLWKDLEAAPINEQSAIRAVKADPVAMLVQPILITFSAFVNADKARVLVGHLERVGRFPIVL